MSTIFEELENLKPEAVGTHTQLALEWFRTNIRRIFDRRMNDCLLYTSPSPRDQRGSRMPSSA